VKPSWKSLKHSRSAKSASKLNTRKSARFLPLLFFSANNRTHWFTFRPSEATIPLISQPVSSREYMCMTHLLSFRATRCGVNIGTRKEKRQESTLRQSICRRPCSPRLPQPPPHPRVSTCIQNRHIAERRTMVTHRQNYPFTIITVGMGRSPQYHSPVVDARRANGAYFFITSSIACGSR